MRQVCFIIRLLSAGCLLFAGCTQPQLAGGTSTSENGRVIGRILDQYGAPAKGARVLLLPADYDPVKHSGIVVADTTDSLGNYTLQKINKGDYAILAMSLDKKTSALIRGIRSLDSIDTIATDTLRAPGSVKIALPANVNLVNGYVYIPGSFTFSHVVNNSRIVILDSVPAVASVNVAYSTTTSSTATVLRYGVRVRSGDTTIVWNSAWSYSRKITLNTSSSGANVNSSVTNFPALIRLTAANFDFTQAKSNGDDIRFTKSDTTFLPYEIERWDSVAKLAEVWVKVDTINGNDSAQSITMLWGDSSATGSSNGAAVFDTANGFAAVWHLNTDCSDITTGKHDGTNFGATDTVGIIGGAKKFNGSSYIQVPGLLGEPQSITLSAWVHLDSTIIFSQDIVSLGDAVALRADRVAAPYYGTQGFFCSSVSASDTVFVFTNTGAFISKTGWRYLVYTVDGTRHVQSMYIDGIFQCSTNDINPINYSGLGPNTFLGTHGNKKTQSYAIGCIDEARVCRVARSADWIKLCYMNQKQQDALVRW